MRERIVKMKQSLCEKFCPYYKPAKEEDLACLGSIIIGGLIKQGVGIPSENRNSPLAPSVSAILLEDMCIRCPFYDDDCDFAMVSRGNKSISSTSAQGSHGKQLPAQGHIPSPCGGFTVLGYLLDEKIINIDDIKKLI